ncbi:MAG: hypothetical protein V4524_01610 [Patescibacteria group bacterium]
MKEKPQYHLDNGAIFKFLAVAGFADLITFIPITGDFVSPVFWLCASLYLWKKGLGLINARRLGVELISFIAELIPGIQEFPTILAAAIAIVVMSRIEDKTGFKIPLKGRGTNSPVNNNRVRLPETQTGNSYIPNTTSGTGSSGGKGRVINYNAGPLNTNGVRVAVGIGKNQTKTNQMNDMEIAEAMGRKYASHPMDEDGVRRTIAVEAENRYIADAQRRVESIDPEEVIPGRDHVRDIEMEVLNRRE